MDKDRLKECAEQAGADIVGIANIERFDELPPEKHPRSIFPEAKSVIVLGRRITRGTLRGVEEGTNFTNYSLYGYDWLDNRFIALTTFTVSEFLEDNGWEAVPLPNLPPEVPPMGVKVKKEIPAPNVMLDFDDAAVRAGVGEIGYLGVLLTPQFGPRQRIQIILTDAEIEPDPILRDDICTRDSRLKDFCPLGAIEGEREVVILGKKMVVAEIDYKKCASCKNGAMPNRYHPAGKPDRLAAVCIRSYADYLEKNGRIKNRFKMPFRQRDAWTVVKEEVDLYRY
jgi:epoxyqueuosine reductase